MFDVILGPIMSVLLIVAVFIVSMLVVVVALKARGRGGGRKPRLGGDFVVVVRPDGTTTSYDLEQLIPPVLYTYSPSQDVLGLLIVRSPPLVYYDPRKGVYRRMWFAVEKNLVALTLDLGEAHVLSLANDVLGNFNVDDVIRLVEESITKRVYEQNIVLPNEVRISFSYNIHPAVGRIVGELLKTRAEAFTSVLAGLRVAKEAKALAEAAALRGKIGVQRIVSIAILIIVIALAMVLIMRGLGLT